MKLSKYLIPISLAVAVVVSLVLSVVLWTNPANYRNRQNATNNPQTNMSTSSKNDIFTPSQAIANDSNGKQEVLVNSKVNAVAQIKGTMQDFKNAKIKKISQNSKSKYLQIGRRKNSILLNYPSPIPMNILNGTVNGRFRNFPNYSVSRIILPTDNSNTLYLLNDQGFKVYQVTVKSHDLNPLRKVIAADQQKILVSLKMFNGFPVVFIMDTTPMQPYKVLVEKQTQDFYVSRLLNNENSQNINMKKHKNVVTYSDAANDLQLTLNTKTQAAQLSNYQPNNGRGDFTSIIENSYEGLEKSGIPLDNVRFYGYDEDTKTATYRTFVEGFPIFQANGAATYSSQTVNDSLTKCSFWLNNLQVPLPNRKAMVSLPSTSTIISGLVTRGFNVKQIKMIRLGYRWQVDPSSSMVIDLIPDVYVYYQNKWVSYTQVMNNQ